VNPFLGLICQTAVRRASAAERPLGSRSLDSMLPPGTCASPSTDGRAALQDEAFVEIEVAA